MNDRIHSRRRFLATTGTFVSTSWLALHWPAIAAAADHAHHVDDESPATPARFEVLTPAEVTALDAMTNQIVPGGDTPGARDAHVVYFIDRALATFYASRLPDLRQGLDGVRQQFRAAHDDREFSSGAAAEQIGFLSQIESSAFFQSLRQLTVLGLIASPKYGGNFNKSGWQLLGFVDQHVFTPPFGDYDKDYAGFVPYTEAAAPKAGA